MEIMDLDLDVRPLMEMGWHIDVALEEGLRRTIAAEKELLFL